MKNFLVFFSVTIVSLLCFADYVEAQKRNAMPSTAEAVTNAYFRYRVSAESGGALSPTGFRKTNGYEQGFGLYVLEWQAEVLFQQDGYKAGDMFVGYWQNFQVLRQQPGTLDSLIVGNTIHFDKGTTVRLTGNATLRNTEKGPRIEGFEVKTSQVMSTPADTTLRVYRVLHLVNDYDWGQKKSIKNNPSDAVIDQTVELFRKRLKMLGVPIYSVERGVPPRETSDLIVVKIPAVINPGLLWEIVGMQGRLEIVHLISPSAPLSAQKYSTVEEAVASVGSEIPASRRILSDYGTGSTKYIVVESNAVIDSSDLLKCQTISPSGQEEDFQVSCSLKRTSENRLYKWSRANRNQYVGIVIDGIVNSIVNIDSLVRGSITISGKFSKLRAERTAIVLMSGVLPTNYRVEFLEEDLLSNRDSK